MYPNIPFPAAILFLAAGLWALAWSANKFVDAAGSMASRLGVPPFIIGMVVIGFGTSAPELAVSALSALGGSSGLSLGNAWGSNIYNIAVILGVAALIRPITIRNVSALCSAAMLVGISLLSGILVYAGNGLSRIDALIMLTAFAILLPVSCRIEKLSSPDESAEAPASNMAHPYLIALASLAMLIGSSHLLVWGAVDVARFFNVSELLIGLTIVAAGTSLPELASAIVSARRGQHDFVVGNIVGSNFFNTLAVVGLSGLLAPFETQNNASVFRDLAVMTILSFSILLFGFSFKSAKGSGSIGHIKGLFWLIAFAAYLILILFQEQLP